LGLCGILAHHLQPAKVVLTDGDTDTLAFMRSNIETNCSPSSETGDDGETANTSNIQSRQLVWANRADERLQAFSQEHGPFDLILGSDIIYVEEILEPLFATVAQLLSPNEATVGQFWLAYARRNVSIDLVLETAAAFGFSFTTPADAEGVFVFQRAPF
jgi:predicted nicotinamide N-methyase